MSIKYDCIENGQTYELPDAVDIYDDLLKTHPHGYLICLDHDEAEELAYQTVYDCECTLRTRIPFLDPKTWADHPENEGLTADLEHFWTEHTTPDLADWLMKDVQDFKKELYAHPEDYPDFDQDDWDRAEIA